MSPDATLRAALQLHALGINVARAAPGTKRPLGSWKRWQTERQVERHVTDAFAGGGSIFAPTGSISGICVLDCDDQTALNYWTGRLGSVLQRTATVRTARGRHFWFSLADGAAVRGRSSEGGESGKWNLRADGGGVMAPPSIHPDGHVYAWEEGRGLAALQPAPEALLDSAPEASRGPNLGINGAAPAGGSDWDP